MSTNKYSQTKKTFIPHANINHLLTHKSYALCKVIFLVKQFNLFIDNNCPPTKKRKKLPTNKKKKKFSFDFIAK